MSLAPLLLALGAPPAAAAAAVPLDYLPALKGGYLAIDSKAVGRRFHIYVRVPEEYAKAPERRWPVVYLLDGDSAFPMAAPEHLFLHYDEGVEDAIVVGIAYGSFDPTVNKRDVDYLAEAPPGGQAGAAAFAAFLKTELLPAVERRFRADPARRVLVGQSYGGTFVLWSALADPDLFWGRIASNPSFRYGRAELFGPPAAGARRQGLGVVVVSGTRNNAEGRRGALDWAAAWAARKDAPWAVKEIDIPGGTHAAAYVDAYRAGMLWLLRGGAKAAAPPPPPQ
jgi:predicted alpha/beta superfamily hydrolase